MSYLNTLLNAVATAPSITDEELEYAAVEEFSYLSNTASLAEEMLEVVPDVEIMEVLGANT